MSNPVNFSMVSKTRHAQFTFAEKPQIKTESQYSKNNNKTLITEFLMLEHKAFNCTIGNLWIGTSINVGSLEIKGTVPLSSNCLAGNTFIV